MLVTISANFAAQQKRSLKKLNKTEEGLELKEDPNPPLFLKAVFCAHTLFFAEAYRILHLLLHALADIEILL